MKSVLHIGLGLTKSTGGTSKAVEDFTSAFDGNVVWGLIDKNSISDAERYRREWEYLITSRIPVLRSYSYVPMRNMRAHVNSLPPLSAVFCHVLFRYNANMAMQLSRVHRCPLFVVPHGSLDPWVMSYRTYQKKIWMRLCGRKLLKRSRCFIYASEVEASRAKLVIGEHSHKVVGWPVYVPDIAAHRANKELVRRELGIESTSRVMISLGRLHVGKGVLDVIKTAVAADDGKVHLVIIGPEDGVTIGECRQAGASLGARLHVIGPVFGDKKWSYLCAADCYISLSKKENFNYTLVEAMACGLPVIVSPGNALNLTLRDLGCGWMLLGDSIEEAVRATKDFLSVSGSALTQMGGRGMRHVMNKYSQSTFQSGLRSLFSF